MFEIKLQDKLYRYYFIIDEIQSYTPFFIKFINFYLLKKNLFKPAVCCKKNVQIYSEMKTVTSNVKLDKFEISCLKKIFKKKINLDSQIKNIRTFFVSDLKQETNNDILDRTNT